jgi:hypothetical protein
MNACCAPSANPTFPNLLSTLMALVTGPRVSKPGPADRIHEVSAAHRRALARAAGIWGGYQAAPPSR